MTRWRSVSHRALTGESGRNKPKSNPHENVIEPTRRKSNCHAFTPSCPTAKELAYDRRPLVRELSVL